MSNQPTCVIIGASHAGVNCAFALRREGWEGAIHLYDSDPMLPYHRPPLSKGYLSGAEKIEDNVLKSADSYREENIHLHLGLKVTNIHPTDKHISLQDGSTQAYDHLVLATGARPLIPPIRGLESAQNIFSMRTAQDATDIREAFQASQNKRIAVIGGGYIGLETAASLKKLGAEAIILERENRILSRVTSPEMSQFFHQLHTEKGVQVWTQKNVVSVESNNQLNIIHCEDGTRYEADMIVLGVGIRVNTQLAETAGLDIHNGIRVDASTRTSDESIYAIGDCTYHHNPHYDCFIRLESVQNAVDQAKIAAAAICGKEPVYNSIPWFWSDQYDVKLQMVGLSNGYDEVVVRKEAGDGHRFSVWYFKGDTLLAVDAVNNAKAYVLGTKFIKGGTRVDKKQLADPTVDFKPAALILH